MHLCTFPYPYLFNVIKTNFGLSCRKGLKIIFVDHTFWKRLYFSSDKRVPQDADRMQLQLFFKERFWNIQCTKWAITLYEVAFQFFLPTSFVPNFYWSSYLLRRSQKLSNVKTIRNDCTKFYWPSQKPWTYKNRAVKNP